MKIYASVISLVPYFQLPDVYYTIGFNTKKTQNHYGSDAHAEYFDHFDVATLMYPQQPWAFSAYDWNDNLLTTLPSYLWMNGCVPEESCFIPY